MKRLLPVSRMVDSGIGSLSVGSIVSLWKKRTTVSLRLDLKASNAREEDEQ